MKVAAFAFVLLALSARGSPQSFVEILKIDEIPFLGSLLSDKKLPPVAASGVNMSNIADLPAAFLQELLGKSEKFNQLVQAGFDAKDAVISDLIAREATLREAIVSELTSRGTPLKSAALSDIAAKQHYVQDLLQRTAQEGSALFNKIPVPTLSKEWHLQGAVGAVATPAATEAPVVLSTEPPFVPSTETPYAPSTEAPAQPLAAFPQIIPAKEEIYNLLKDQADALIATKKSAINSLVGGKVAAVQSIIAGEKEAAQTLINGATSAYEALKNEKLSFEDLLGGLEGLSAEKIGETFKGFVNDVASEVDGATQQLRGFLPESLPDFEFQASGFIPSFGFGEELRKLTLIQPHLARLYEHLEKPAAAEAFRTLNTLFEEIKSMGKIENLEALVKPFKAFGSPLDVQLAVSNACLAFLEAVNQAV